MRRAANYYPFLDSRVNSRRPKVPCIFFFFFFSLVRRRWHIGIDFVCVYDILITSSSSSPSFFFVIFFFYF